MVKTLCVLPISFWGVIVLIAVGSLYALHHLRDGFGLPMLAVIGTLAAWYVVDAFYNDYANYHSRIFAPEILKSSWWQVAWFLVVFLFATPYIHRWMNIRLIARGSGVFRMFKLGVNQPGFQRQLDLLFFICMAIWLSLVTIAAFRINGNILGFLFPFLGNQVSPWGRNGRLGSGLDALWTMLDYFQMLASAIFGVTAALSTNRRTRYLAILFCFLSWPYFIIDRTRNRMLTVTIPGVLSMVFLRLKGGIIKKFFVLFGCFLVVNAWMAFVITNRSGMSITRAIKEKGFNFSEEEKVHHEGLNMYEELCWINTFIKDGSYHPNWGSRYFAEMVNFIPRPLWPDKPMLGIDYAIARGQGSEGGQAGVDATICTGLVGQGVVNFGRVLGPLAAALLMGLWAATLAKLDLRINEFGRLPLYFVGLILTFNTGRDITLITLYPFLFGLLALRFYDRYVPHGSNAPKTPGLQILPQVVKNKLGKLPAQRHATHRQNSNGQTWLISQRRTRNGFGKNSNYL